MILLRQSTAVTLLIGPFVDDEDGNTAETGLTIAQADVRVSKNGGNMAQKNDGTSCTHDELGYYTCPLDTTDTNTLGQLKIMVHESGALPVWVDCLVVTANVYDTFCSTDQLDVNVTNIEGSDPTDQINAACDTALTDYDAVVPGDLPTNFSSMGIEADGHVHADVKEIEGADPSDQIRDSVVDDANRLDGSALNGLASNDPGSTIASQSDITGLNDPTADAIADAVWNEDIGSHTDVGSAGEAQNKLDAIEEDTNEIQGDLVDGGRIDLILDAILGDTNELQSDNIPGLIAALNDFDPTSDQVIVGSNTDKTGYSLSSAGVDDILDEEVEGTLTHRQILRIVLSVLAGLSTGGGTSTLNFRDVADSKNRVRATVDANQNRTGITLDGE